MPDWKAEIRTRLAALKLSPSREAEVVEELAQHLDDAYERSLQLGANPGEAYRAALDELAESDLLASELRQVERHFREPRPVGRARKKKPAGRPLAGSPIWHANPVK